LEKNDELVLLGRLGRPWGLRGELMFRPENAGALPFHLNFTALFIEGVEEPLEVEGWRVDGSGRLYLHLRGIDAPEGARALSDRPVYVRRADLPETGAGVWYVYRLVGLTARYPDGTPAGRIVDVEPGAGAANDVLVVETPEGGELLVPFVRAVVLSVDPEGGRVVLRRMSEDEVNP
jgi:16S rRNA processing protein RimM